MSDFMKDHPFYHAFALVGGFLCNWALLESDIHDAIQKALGMERIQFLIVRGNLQLRDKINILRTAADFSLTIGTTEKKEVDKTLLAIADYSAARNMMAHDMFGPAKDGNGVEFQVVKAKGKLQMPEVVWTEDDFLAAYTKVQSYAKEVQNLTNLLQFAALARAMAGPASFFGTTLPRGVGDLLGLQTPLPLRHLDSDTGPAIPETETQTPPTETE